MVMYYDNDNDNGTENLVFEVAYDVIYIDSMFNMT